jgi:hypothetical protein
LAITGVIMTLRSLAFKLGGNPPSSSSSTG